MTHTIERPEVSENAEVVSFRVRKHTLEQLQEIKAATRAPSVSDAMRRAVDLGALLINAMEEGDKIIIEGKDGHKTQILISGISK